MIKGGEGGDSKVGNVAAAVIDIAERAKWDSYMAGVAKRPKQDRRAFAAAGPQAQFVMLAVREWYEWFMDSSRVGGLPRENVLYRAALLIPRAPSGSAAAPTIEPPKVVVLVEKAVADLDDDQAIVLVTNEQFGHLGVDRVAHRLKLNVDIVKDRLKDARRSIASHLRGAGVRVPKDD